MGNIKLLVVDDDREFCRLVRECLRMTEGVDFAGAAYDGITALDYIREHKPDVVLLDNVMPELDGVGVLKHLGNFEKSQRPKVVTITAVPTNTYMTEMYKLGADYVMSRKADIAEIVERCVMVANDKKEIFDDAGVEEMITSIICALGVPANLKGYPYLRSAILMATENGNLIYSITKELYPEVAKIYQTTASKVERNIRNAIEIAWARGNKQALSEVFEIAVESINNRPTNSEFIAMIADKIRMRLRRKVIL